MPPAIRNHKPRAGSGLTETESNLLSKLAHHDAEIVNLSSRMSGVEQGLRSLQENVAAGFTNLSVKFDKLDNRPVFDFAKTISTIVQIAALFSLIVGGIIYITTSQFAPLNQQVERNEKALSHMTETLTEIRDKLGWIARTEPRK